MSQTIAGTPAQKKTPDTAKRDTAIRKTVQAVSKMALPKAELRTLIALIERLGKDHQIAAQVQMAVVEKSGKFAVTLKQQISDNGAITAREFSFALHTAVTANPGWIFQQAMGGKLTSARSFRLLRGAPSFNRKAAAKLHLRATSGDPLLRSVIAGVVKNAYTFGQKASLNLTEFRTYLNVRNTESMMRAFDDMEYAHIQEPQLKDGDKREAMPLGKALRGRSIRQMLERFRNDIEYAASVHKVDPDLIRAIIYEQQSHILPTEDFIERNMEPVARFLGVGKTVGLGQITEGLEGFTRAQLLEPRANIAAIATHLETLSSR